MRYSDNAAANLLARKLGGPTAITRFARSLGDPPGLLGAGPQLVRAVAHHGHDDPAHDRPHVRPSGPGQRHEPLGPRPVDPLVAQQHRQRDPPA
ncbi:hypothetical protein ACIHCQ_36525 [Streptomyces sp. NPDC052236]|uniref:hypothetical protein n=1 Tax=Streptomyces sp. NPDC052236 TaxID=3365686 RepID=UPI0037CE0C24